MNSKFKNWIIAAGIRAIKTFAQAAVGMIAIGAAFDEIGWIRVVSVSAVAAILSLLTSLKGLPELSTDGTLKVDISDPEKDIYNLELGDSLDTLAEKSIVRFGVTKTVGKE